MSVAIASRFARALADILVDNDAANDAVVKLRAFDDLQQGSPELKNI